MSSPPQPPLAMVQTFAFVWEQHRLRGILQPIWSVLRDIEVQHPRNKHELGRCAC